MIKIRNKKEGDRKTALQKIGEFLEEEQGRSNAEMIRRMREACFADVDALEKSGRVKIPECRTTNEHESTPLPHGEENTNDTNVASALWAERL